MKLLAVAILGLLGMNAVEGLSHKNGFLKAASAKLANPEEIEEIKAWNKNNDDNFVGNLGINGLNEFDMENEKSFSHSGDFSAEKHHDSQKVDISIHFNIGGDSSSDSCTESSELQR